MSGLLSRKEIRTLLVDDEEIAIYRLKKALESYPQIKIIGEAKDGKEAIGLINDQRPDLVFLDIQMPVMNGFEVLNYLDYLPQIVFVTAYEEYAIKAFEKNSLDYLLKPVEDDRLSITIKRALESKAIEDNVLYKIKMLINENRPKDIITTIPVKSGNKITLIHMADICFFEAKDKYVYIHTYEGESLIDYSLGYLQERLPEQFLRVHRGFIINKLTIREIHKYFKGTYILVMNDSKGTKIKSAYSYSDEIREKLLLV
ncbi:LytR/AlgR family response regulator transcription factor [Dyadobacter subterraneus]|uniref:LytTR family transcriptional regulator DNA-binding domain-containing protein n=1 Tax=Dyadobacter subterraneus TaxID=2773304 RepID=A0ABR9W9C3_9BACT|nr:LytTR family transcriptional regulator DNA-binding domain-containing protein [Dyadobacter subterraneus]MBE9461536.1 LytTR family transcriptional regulator DNA-binding domain-containing protein [Dyadobacter subterraneus]